MVFKNHILYYKYTDIIFYFGKIFDDKIDIFKK